MALTLSEYLLRDFNVEHVDARVIELGEGRVRFPAISRCWFHLVLEGVAELRLDESDQRAELQAGNFALLLYGAPHTIARRGTNRSQVVHLVEKSTTDEEPAVLSLHRGGRKLCVLSGELWLSRTLRSAPVNRALAHVLCYPARPSGGARGVRPLHDVTGIEKACLGRGASAFVFGLAQLYLIQVLRQADEDLRETFPVQVGAPEMGRMASVVRKIRTHPERRWTVASLAQEMGCSRSSFAAKFQAYAGQGPIKFVAKTRLMAAATMLKNNSDLPLWEVARRVGYDTQSSFTRAFKAQFKVSPRAYVERLSIEPDA